MQLRHLENLAPKLTRRHFDLLQCMVHEQALERQLDEVKDQHDGRPIRFLGWPMAPLKRMVHEPGIVKG